MRAAPPQEDAHRYVADGGRHEAARIEERERGQPAQPAAAPRDGADAIPAAPAAPGAVSEPFDADAGAAGQRRYLTVLFSDLVGSTRLSEELDPEDMRDLVLAYQTATTSAIEADLGFVAQYLGDGILAYFGYPEAHEDDARQAVRAGLAIAEVAASLRARFGRPDIAVRVGIHSGEVVITDLGGRRRQRPDVVADVPNIAVGDVPNVAARLQSLAEPGEVLISAATAALVRGWFGLEDRGPVLLKGVSRPLTVYRVEAPTGAESRIDATISSGLTPLVGRDEEMRLLTSTWEAVHHGRGRVVALSGEAGIGKSRLVRELENLVGHEASMRVRLQCSPHRGSSALFPLIEHLNRVIGEHGRPAERLDRLEKQLRDADLPLASAGPLIAELLGIPFAHRWEATVESAERKKRRTLDAIHSWLLAGSEHAPVLLVVEDLHWIDPTTLELLAPYFGPEPIDRVLAIVTHRSDYVLPWPDRPHAIRLALDRLSAEDVMAIVEIVARDTPLPESVKEQISLRTDGVPLFAEEITHAVLESGEVEEGGSDWLSGNLPDHLVPSTVRESLMARIDRLGSARSLAQLMATVGREVGEDFLRALVPDEQLEEQLASIVSTDLVRRRRAGRQTSYVFKHWLVRDVAYESLLRSDRQRYHERIAETLIRDFPEQAHAQPEVVAHHLVAAGQPVRAIDYLQRAGEAAARRSANLEAIAHFRRAVDLLQGEPPSHERDERELGLLIAVGAPLTACKGYSAPEVEQTYSRAGELCRAVGGESPHLFRALYGTWRVHLLRADYAKAVHYSGELEKMAQPGDPTQQAATHRAIGSTLLYLGRIPTARSHLERVIAAGSADNGTAWLEELQDVVDPWVTCQAYDSWALWLQGEQEGADRAAERAISMAANLEHPFTVDLSLAFTSWLRQFAGDAPGVHELAERALNLALDQGFQFWVGWARIMHGWAEAVLGDPAGGIEAMQVGLREWRAVGSELGTPYFLYLLAETFERQGRIDEAMETLAEADAVTTRTGEGWWLPELHRLRGLLLHRQGRTAEAEARFRLAARLASEHGALALELRASASLAGHGLDSD